MKVSEVVQKALGVNYKVNPYVDVFEEDWNYLKIFKWNNKAFWLDRLFGQAWVEIGKVIGWNREYAGEFATIIHIKDDFYDEVEPLLNTTGWVLLEKENGKQD